MIRWNRISVRFSNFPIFRLIRFFSANVFIKPTMWRRRGGIPISSTQIWISFDTSWILILTTVNELHQSSSHKQTWQKCWKTKSPQSFPRIEKQKFQKYSQFYKKQILSYISTNITTWTQANFTRGAGEQSLLPSRKIWKYIWNVLLMRLKSTYFSTE